MALSALVGNRQLKEQLQPRLSGGLGHAYILSGPKGCGKHTLASVLSRAMVCSGTGGKPCDMCPDCKKAAAGIHPDIITVAPLEEGKQILVDQVREFRADAYIRPNEAPRKVYVVEQADSMNPNAQNAMLKLLEDGPAYAAFLLLAENSGALLTTVRSRCEVLALTPVSLPEARQWLDMNFPLESQSARQQAAEECQGILGRAVIRLSQGAEEDTELETLARKTANDWLAGDEMALMALCATVDVKKWNRNRFSAFMDRLRLELCDRAGTHPDRRRVMQGIELTDQLRQALSFNAHPAHLCGWLCAEAGIPK